MEVTTDLVVAELSGESSPSVRSELEKPENVSVWRDTLISLKRGIDVKLQENRKWSADITRKGRISGDSKWYHSEMAKVDAERTSLVRDKSIIEDRLIVTKKVMRENRRDEHIGKGELTVIISLLETAAMFVPKDMGTWFDKFEGIKSKLGSFYAEPDGNTIRENSTPGINGNR